LIDAALRRYYRDRLDAFWHRADKWDHGRLWQSIYLSSFSFSPIFFFCFCNALKRYTLQSIINVHYKQTILSDMISRKR
jgi:hypothetical protein